MGDVYGKGMEPVPVTKWPFMPAWETRPIAVWRSRDYLAVLYEQMADGRRRLAVNSVRRMGVPISKRREGSDWRDGITWDELQRVKNECLGEDVWCVEVYPAQDKLVDVSNMRHLWVLDAPPETRFPERAVMTDEECRREVELLKKIREMTRR